LFVVGVHGVTWMTTGGYDLHGVTQQVQLVMHSILTGHVFVHSRTAS
jgi:hypothetical protein